MHHDAAGCPLPLIIPIYPPWEWALAAGHRSFWWLRSGDLQLDEWYLGHLDGSSSLQQHIALGMCWWMLESKLHLEWLGETGKLSTFWKLEICWFGWGAIDSLESGMKELEFLSWRCQDTDVFHISQLDFVSFDSRCSKWAGCWVPWVAWPLS